jgi:uncharacterized protein
MLQQLGVGFMIGCLSSFHCIGMCGPLSLSLPIQHLRKSQREFVLFLYNIGRVVTYSILGLLCGVAGRTFHIAGLQQTLSIVLGATLLVSAVTVIAYRRNLRPAYLAPIYSFVYRNMNMLLQRRTNAGYFLLGITNGLLPCGMVYLALALAASLTHIGDSIAVMFGFGLGTLPAMLAVGYAGLSVSIRMRQNIRKSMPVLVIVSGILLILRGMNLGIPFLSPGIHAHTGTIISCHE